MRKYLSEAEPHKAVLEPIMILLCFLQLASIGVANGEDQRRALREMLFTAPDIQQHISGVVCTRDRASKPFCLHQASSHIEKVEQQAGLL